MSLDRRIVSILYFNGITDVNQVEKFIGENEENYYEVIIDGNLRKLKIPGLEYFENEVYTEANFVEELKKSENEKQEILKSFEEPSFEEKLLNAEMESKKIKKPIKKSVDKKTLEEEIVKPFYEKKQIENFEEELKNSEIEKQEILKSFEESPLEEMPKVKKAKVKEKTKKLDDDINDFIDII